MQAFYKLTLEQIPAVIRATSGIYKTSIDADFYLFQEEMPLQVNGMILEYIDCYNPSRGIRVIKSPREGFIIIEPSGIEIPISCLQEISEDRIPQNSPSYSIDSIGCDFLVFEAITKGKKDHPNYLHYNEFAPKERAIQSAYSPSYGALSAYSMALYYCLQVFSTNYENEEPIVVSKEDFYSDLLASKRNPKFWELLYYLEGDMDAFFENVWLFLRRRGLIYPEIPGSDDTFIVHRVNADSLLKAINMSTNGDYEMFSTIVGFRNNVVQTNHVFKIGEKK